MYSQFGAYVISFFASLKKEISSSYERRALASRLTKKFNFTSKFGINVSRTRILSTRSHHNFPTLRFLIRIRKTTSTNVLSSACKCSDEIQYLQCNVCLVYRHKRELLRPIQRSLSLEAARSHSNVMLFATLSILPLYAPKRVARSYHKKSHTYL